MKNYNSAVYTLVVVVLFIFTSSHGVFSRPSIEFVTLSNIKINNEDIYSLGEPPVIGAYQKNYAGRVVNVISEVGNSEATIPQLKVEDHIWEGKSIQLDCSAKYPVQWTYNGPGSPPVHVETSRRAPDFYKPDTYSFSTSVTFTHTAERQTGNYSCQSIENPNMVTYMYLFVPGQKIFMGDTDANLTLKISPRENDPWVTLPCEVSAKDARVHLYKSLPAGTVEELKISDSLTFDPKTGFRLKWRGAGVVMREPWGNYFCKAHYEERQEKLHFRLTTPKYENSDSSKANENQLSYFEGQTSDNSVLKFDFDKAKRRIQCCSADANVRPKLIQSRCESISDCQIRRIYVEGKACHPKCRQTYIHANKSCAAHELGDYKDSGIIECSLGDSEKKYFQYSYKYGNLISDFTKEPVLSKILKIYKENPSQNGTGTYTCDANQFYFSHGLKWGLQKPNGTLEIIPEETFPAKHEIEVNEKENTAVLCFAPVWDSATEWRNVSMEIS